MSTATTALGAVLGLLLMGGLAFLVRDVFRRLSGSGFVLLAGLVGLFVGERWLAGTDLRPLVSGASVLVLLASLGLRAYAMLGSADARRAGHRGALAATAVTLGSLLVYAATLPPVTAALGVADAALVRWNGALWSIFPIFTVAGLVPVLLIDQVLANHPRAMPSGALRAVSQAGLSMALGLSLLFPLNYLADAWDIEKDVAYFRTTQPGESTIAIVTTAADPIEALLFYSAGNEVGQQLERYFKALAAASGGQLSYRLVDQALDPKLSEEADVRTNGMVVLRQGENKQNFKIAEELDRAKRDLRKLDGTVNKTLLKLTTGSRDVYFLTGHGEASTRERDNDLRKLNVWKRDVLEAQNFKVKTYGLAEGSAQAVPEGAGVVIIAAPTEPLLPEEIDALVAFFEAGGALLITLEPDSKAPLAPLLARLGVEAGTAPLANTQFYIKETGQKADRVLLATNKFGTHASVKTLSRNSQQVGLVMPTSVRVNKAAEPDAAAAGYKVSTLIRALDNTFEDVDGDREPGDAETKENLELGVAVETVGEKPGRAIIVGDTSMLSDPILRLGSKGNVLFSYDTVRWLVGDEDIAGEIESEEDRPIQHTHEEDTAWFLLSVVGVPGLVLVFGFVMMRLRRREGAA